MHWEWSFFSCPQRIPPPPTFTLTVPIPLHACCEKQATCAWFTPGACLFFFNLTSTPHQSVVASFYFRSEDMGAQRGEGLVKAPDLVCLSLGLPVGLCPTWSVMLFKGFIDPWPWRSYSAPWVPFQWGSRLGVSVLWSLSPKVVSDFGCDSFPGNILRLYKSSLFYIMYFQGTFLMDCSWVNLVLPFNQTTGQIAQFWILVLTCSLAMWPWSS